MARFFRIIFFLTMLSSGAAASPAHAQARLKDLVTLTVLDGGQTADGTHLAALRLDMQDGWKTYWRIPGDAGIPPGFSWQGSRNVHAVEIVWPTPVVFAQSGYQSIGYIGKLVLPLKVTPGQRDTPIRLRGAMDFGICRDVCIPARIAFSAVLAPGTEHNPAIAAALARRPFSPAEAGVGSVTCEIRPTQGGWQIETRIRMPESPGAETVVLEPGNPEVRASEMQSYRKGGTLVAKGKLAHADGRSFALNRSNMKITVLSRGMAVEINGCTPS